jgi:hypothetical protein
MATGLAVGGLAVGGAAVGSLAIGATVGKKFVYNPLINKFRTAEGETTGAKLKNTVKMVMPKFLGGGGAQFNDSKVDVKYQPVQDAARTLYSAGSNEEKKAAQTELNKAILDAKGKTPQSTKEKIKNIIPSWLGGNKADPGTSKLKNLLGSVKSTFSYTRSSTQAQIDLAKEVGKQQAKNPDGFSSSKIGNTGLNSLSPSNDSSILSKTPAAAASLKPLPAVPAKPVATPAPPRTAAPTLTKVPTVGIPAAAAITKPTPVVAALKPVAAAPTIPKAPTMVTTHVAPPRPLPATPVKTMTPPPLPPRDAAPVAPPPLPPRVATNAAPKPLPAPPAAAGGTKVPVASPIVTAPKSPKIQRIGSSSNLTASKTLAPQIKQKI